MNHLLTVYYDNKPSYDILVDKSYDLLKDKLCSLNMAGRRFLIMSDSNVSKHYCEAIKDNIAPIASSIAEFIFDAGEDNKNLDTISECYEVLIRYGFDRNDIIIALGGGVVGDMAGFAAATYLRGIQFIQLPTSLLAMVDSSIGGKTGVDFKAYKNMVGAFHQPKLVYINLTTLTTLPDREFYSGMGEIIKHGLIKSNAYYSWLKEHREAVIAKDIDLIGEMIIRSCMIKKDVVQADPKEAGERALLNFGHTIGHSIEKLMNFSLLHGECVAVGMASAAFISLNRGLISETEYIDILETIKAFKLPISITGLIKEDIYMVTRLDKKMDLDTIRFILLKEIGEAIIDPTVSKDEIIKAAESILEESTPDC